MCTEYVCYVCLSTITIVYCDNCDNGCDPFRYIDNTPCWNCYKGDDE